MYNMNDLIRYNSLNFYLSIENDTYVIDPIFSIENDISLTDIFHLQPALINKIGGALRAPPIFAGPFVYKQMCKNMIKITK